MARNGSGKCDVIKKKKGNKKLIIFFVIYVIVAILVTTVLLVIKMDKVNTNKVSSNNNNSNVVNDASYVITDYKEMYYQNPLEFKDENYYKEKNGGESYIDIQYIVVSGLKDKKFQEKINNEIKEAAYKYFGQASDKDNYMAYSRINANYSNVLSICVSISIWDTEKGKYKVYEDIGLNYNLLTSEKLLLDDLFTSNVPMNHIISELVYEKLAWEVDYDSDEWQAESNMDDRDTSEYEDIILNSVLDFSSTKSEDREFYFTPSKLYIKIKLSNNNAESFEDVELYKYSNYFVIYKKFVVDDNKLADIYETIPSKKGLVFIGNEDAKISEHVSSNMYLYVNVLDSTEDDEEALEKYGQKLINIKNEVAEKELKNIVNNYKDIANKNSNYGYIARALMVVYIYTYENEYGKEDYIEISVETALDRTDIAYYNNSAFKSYAASRALPVADAWTAVLGNIADKKITRTDETRKQYFYDVNGKLIAKSTNELDKYMNNKYMPAGE